LNRRIPNGTYGGVRGRRGDAPPTRFERMGMFEEISHSKWKFQIVVKEELYAF